MITAQHLLSECGSRLRVQKCKGLQRMETEQDNISETVQFNGDPKSRPFCIQSVKTTSPLHVMENRSIQSWKGCFSDSLGRQDFNYAFPPIYLIGRVLAKVQRDRASIMLIIPA